MPWVPVTLKSLIKRASDFEPKTFGNHFRKRRLSLGITQEEAGKRVGTTKFTVINWESDYTKPAIKLSQPLSGSSATTPNPAFALPSRSKLQLNAGYSVRVRRQLPGNWVSTLARGQIGRTVGRLWSRPIAKSLPTSLGFRRSKSFLQCGNDGITHITDRHRKK